VDLHDGVSELSSRVTAPRKRIGVVGYLTVEAEGNASEPGDVRCGIPGFDHPGTELYGDTLLSTDPALRCAGRFEDAATPPSPPTSTTAPTPEDRSHDAWNAPLRTHTTAHAGPAICPRIVARIAQSPLS
jgi:hypothetical protein